jgi:hypothetical protein
VWWQAGSAPMTNPSTAGFELEDAQGGSRSTPNHSAMRVQLEEAQGGSIPITPQRVSSSKRPRAAPARWDAGAFSDSSAGWCKTRPALWRRPTRVGRGHCTRLCLPHSVGPLPLASADNPEAGKFSSLLVQVLTVSYLNLQSRRLLQWSKNISLGAKYLCNCSKEIFFT